MRDACGRHLRSLDMWSDGPRSCPRFLNEYPWNPQCEFIQFVRASWLVRIGNSPPTGLTRANRMCVWMSTGRSTVFRNAVRPSPRHRCRSWPCLRPKGV
jgi:hypothetical protein